MGLYCFLTGALAQTKGAGREVQPSVEQRSSRYGAANH